MKPLKKNASRKITANVSTLKVHLGQYLRKVKEGLEVVVLDRQLPVAKIIAFNGNEIDLREIPPSQSWQNFIKNMDENDRRLKRTTLKRNSMSYLNDDRGS